MSECECARLAQVIYEAVEQGWVDEDVAISSVPTPWRDTPQRDRRVFYKAADAVIAATRVEREELTAEMVARIRETVEWLDVVLTDCAGLSDGTSWDYMIPPAIRHIREPLVALLGKMPSNVGQADSVERASDPQGAADPRGAPREEP